MANSPNVIDLSIPLADFLAQSVDDGTYSDIIETLKFDRAGQEAAATQQDEFTGQLWGNLQDDMFLTLYALNQGRKDYELDTVDAATDSDTLATLTTDGDAYRIEATVLGKTATDGEVAYARLQGVYYRTGGTVLLLAPTKTLAQIGLAGVDANLVISGDDVNLEVTGALGFTIAWTGRVATVQEFRAP